MFPSMITVGQSANAEARVFQARAGMHKGKWTWEVADWIGGHFDTEAEAAADMQRVRDRERI